MRTALGTVLRAVFFIGLVTWAVTALASLVLVPVGGADNFALFAGGMHLQNALDELPVNLAANLRAAKKDCEDTPWTGDALRKAHENLELERQAYLTQALPEDAFRASIQDVMRQTEAEGRAAHSRRWASLMLWLGVSGGALLIMGLGTTVFLPRRR